MTKFTKITALVLALVLALSLAACKGGSSGSNTAPTISGTKDLNVEAGQAVNVLEGVTASDKEDGDITGKITVESSPALTFQNGSATPENPGDYELVYSVTDKGGEKAEAYATLTVTRKTGEATVYKTFDFSTAEVTDAHGWEARINESANAEAALKQGAYVFDIVNPGDGDGAVQLAKSGVALKAADYRVKIWAKSTADTYCHILARNENAEGWETFGGAFNVRIGEAIAPLELTFTSEGEGSAELLINLGKITPNPDNPDDTTPENFSVTIDKIEIYEISGEETEAPVYTADFTTGAGLTVEAGDGAAAEAAFDGDAAVANITAYPTDGGVWSIKANLGLGDVAIENGAKYYYRFTMNAENAQEGECLVESATLYHEARVHFNGINAPAGEDTVVYGTFTADRDIADPVIRLQIGNPSDGASSNVIRFTNVEFGKLEGDKEVVKTIDNFIAFGNGTPNAENPDTPWTTFNGTDEDNDLGVGVIWAENGSFFYRIDQGGVVDWHNKLICGYRENPLTLEADSYYTVEIKAKATKNVSCGVFLNPIGNWDPRISEGMDITTEEKTFTFTTTDTFITDMDFELLFQFGSQDLADMGEVTVEFTGITIYQMKIS